MFPRRRAARAFTLIELLVVIAVIGILAGFILAAVSRAQNNAMGTACRNNLRQLGIGLALYLDEYNDCFPMVANLPETAGVGLAPGFSRLADALADEVRDPETFHCPAERKGYFDRDGTSYWWNSMLLNGLWYDGRAHPKRRMDVLRGWHERQRKPDELHVLWDVDSVHGRSVVRVQTDAEGDLVKESEAGAYNVLYLDAVAKPL